MDILEVTNLSKKFGNFTAVDDISFSLKEGEILGLLGPNGAGKTTTIQMLLGIMTPSKGEVVYFGKNIQKNREYVLERINFSSTYTNLPWLLTVKENLHYFSYLYDIKNRKERIERIVEIFRLGDLLKKEIHQLSAGQQTRVNLAKAFINFPKVLLLDEPTASLDPEVASFIREFLIQEREKFQVSIIITSHNMNEVEEVCDRVIFINKGKIIANDTPEHLMSSINIGHVELLIGQNMAHAVTYFKKEKLVHDVQGKYVRVDIKETDIAKFLQKLSEEKISYSEISITKPTMHDYFMSQAKGEEVHEDKL